MAFEVADQAASALEGQGVHVYSMSLDARGTPLSVLEDLLSPDERDRVRRLRFDRHRQRYATGRVGLRRVLARYLDRKPVELRFRAGAHGKPALAPPDDVSRLCFSASYSGDLALFAVALDTEVGVDVERISTRVDAVQIATHLFTENERNVLCRLSPELRLQAFFRCWTRKEAYVKALGVGLSLPLDTFDVALGVDLEPVVEPCSISRTSAGTWSLQDIEVEDGYAAAIVVEGCPTRLPRAAAPISGVSPFC